jgi:hypothetical protein
VLHGLKNIEAQGINSDSHFIQGASKGAVKRISKWFEDKKKRSTDALSAAKEEEEKQKLKEAIFIYDSIILETTEATKRLAEKTAKKRE